jgi:hypothetical protein
MANIFQQQQEMMKIIFQKIQTEKDNLDKMYSEFVNKLTTDNPNNKQYNEIDDLFISKVNKSKEFNDSFTNNDSELLYWYDMNEKKFINPIDGYNNKIIKKFNFEIYLENCLFFDQSKSTIDKITIPFKKYKFESSSGNCNHEEPDTKYKIKQKISEKNLQYLDANKICSLNGTYFLRHEKEINNFCNSTYCIISDNVPTTLKIYIDNYLNIIIPGIQTIIINNYSYFPIYSLYSIYTQLNIPSVKVFNRHNNDDITKYQKINHIIKDFRPFISSEDHRKNYWGNGNLFQDILDFIKYNDMIDNIKPHLDFLASIECKKEIVKSSQSYDDILFQQIKDLQKQIEGYKKQIAKLEKEKEEYNS